MKKFFSMMAVLTAMFAFVACGEPTDEPGPNQGGKLATPELSETHTETSFTVAWNAVSGADAYVVNMGGKNYTTAECSYTFENLNAGDYTVRVKATGKGYQDSDNAKIVVTLTGITECDWFTQTVTPVTEPTQIDEETIVYPYDAVFFSWQGTGVTNIQYGVFATADIQGVSNSQLKQSLSSFGGDGLTTVLSYINGDGFSSVINDLDGSTSYTLIALVTNGEGLEYMAMNEFVTAEAELTAETVSMLGTYNAMTEKMIDLASMEITNETTNFSFTVTPIEGTPDEVYIDGLSIMGTDNPTIGQVVRDGDDILLAVWNYVLFQEMAEGWMLYWYACCDTMGDHYFVSGNYPAYIIVKDAQGALTCESYEGVLSNDEPFAVAAYDLLGVNGENLGFAQDQNGNSFSVWKYGDIKNLTQTAATAKANNAEVKTLSIGGLVPASVVVAK